MYTKNVNLSRHYSSFFHANLFRVLLVLSLVLTVSCAPASQGAASNASTAAPATPSAASSSSSTTSSTGYKTFTGDGSTGAGWPSADQWVDFDTAFTKNKPTMQTSCKTVDQQENDTGSEIDDMKAAIEASSSSTGVAKEFILAVIMQESSGCVRAKTTPNPGAPNGSNPGLMQSAGTTSCFGTSPCPKNKINKMIDEGTAGVDDVGLKQSLVGAKASATAQKTYQAARIYNSGSLDPSGNLATNGATPCYASDIANRLTGFVGTSSCTLSG